MDTKYKQFGECIQELQIEENYFGAKEKQKVVTSTPGDKALRLCKDPIFLLLKLTEQPAMVRYLLALLRAWLYGTKYSSRCSAVGTKAALNRV